MTNDKAAFVRRNQSRHPGESRGPELHVFSGFRRLSRTPTRLPKSCTAGRSGIRRNDRRKALATFCDTVNLDFGIWIYFVVMATHVAVAISRVSE